MRLFRACVSEVDLSNAGKTGVEVDLPPRAVVVDVKTLTDWTWLITYYVP